MPFGAERRRAVNPCGLDLDNASGRKCRQCDQGLFLRGGTRKRPVLRLGRTIPPHLWGVRKVWKLRDIVLAAILSVVCGAVYLGWDVLTQPLFSSAASPAVGAAVNGMWWIAAGLVPYIVRRPGAAFLAEVVSAFFEFAFGSPYGTGAIVSGIVQGLGAEAGFAAGGYRRYGTGSMFLAGALAGVGNSIQWLFQYGGVKYAPAVIVGYIAVTLVSGAVLGGGLPKKIGDALNRTGGLRNFELGRQTRAGYK